MSGAQAYLGLGREALVERIVEQDHEIAALRLQIETLQAEIAQTFAAFTSVLRTLAKTHSGTLVDGLVHVFRFAQLPPLPESR